MATLETGGMSVAQDDGLEYRTMLRLRCYTSCIAGSRTRDISPSRRARYMRDALDKNKR